MTSGVYLTARWLPGKRLGLADSTHRKAGGLNQLSARCCAPSESRMLGDAGLVSDDDRGDWC
jgi:hypothetical protein